MSQKEIEIAAFKAKLASYAKAIADAKEGARFNWLELALDAEVLFGPMCFDKPRKGEAENPDYQALRETVGEVFPMPAAPDRSDKSEKANEARAARKLAGTLISNAMGNMRKYALEASGIELPKSKRQLAKWASSCLATLGDVVGEATAIARVRDALIAAGGTIKSGKIGKVGRKAARRAGTLTSASNTAAASKTTTRRTIKAQVAANAPDLASIGNAMVRANRQAA